MRVITRLKSICGAINKSMKKENTSDKTKSKGKRKRSRRQETKPRNRKTKF